MGDVPWAEERFKAWRDLPSWYVEMAASDPRPRVEALQSCLTACPQLHAFRVYEAAARDLLDPAIGGLPDRARNCGISAPFSGSYPAVQLEHRLARPGPKKASPVDSCSACHCPWAARSRSVSKRASFAASRRWNEQPCDRSPRWSLVQIAFVEVPRDLKMMAQGNEDLVR
jgi:hypothetical protein